MKTLPFSATHLKQVWELSSCRKVSQYVTPRECSQTLKYAQIEKELLANVWSCHKFDQYIYGRDIVHVESDYEPLQAVFKKPIQQSPKRLQRMRMALQNYSLDIQYKKGRLMFIADALSRAYRHTTEDAQHDSSEVHALREVQHEDGLSIAQPTARVQTSHSR